ncbi:MAG: hypothetical protein N4A32_06085 [Marinifilaceae bacterium]|jgi:hypothetical protein|nr:hypothetical protein [Marinifilaceae bacterium]
MKLTKAHKLIQLLFLLANNKTIHIKDILQTLDINERNFYYYLNEIKSVGFYVECKQKKYSFIPKGKCYENLPLLIKITPPDKLIIQSTINNLNINRTTKNNILNVLSSRLVSYLHVSDKYEDYIHTIQKSIDNKKQLVLNYSDKNIDFCQTVIVEPYFIDESNNHFWVYIPTLNSNYLFKLSNIKDILLSPVRQMYTNKHYDVSPDCFGQYGKMDKNCCIELYYQGMENLTDIYPNTRMFISKEKHTNTYTLNCKVCDYKYISGFILSNSELIYKTHTKEINSYIDDLVFNYKNKEK